jgi:hypothetical protein
MRAMEPFEHEPGSPEAIAQGCTCPPQVGPGAVIVPDGRLGYLCDQDCPIHGIEVAQRALARGEGRIIPDNDDEPPPTRH